MSEPTLQARLGHPGANASPKKAWKTPKKPHSADHQHASWPPGDDSSSSYEPEEGHLSSSYVTPSLIERLGPKVTPPAQPRSLLERMELQGSEATDAVETGVAHTPDVNFIRAPFNYERPANVNGGDDREIAVDSFRSEDGESRTGIRPTQPKPWWSGVPATNGTHLARTRSTPPANGDRPDTYRAHAAESERVNGRISEALVADFPHGSSNTTAQNVPETLAINRPVEVSTSTHPYRGLSTDMSSSRNRPPLPLQARLGPALRSVVFQNAKLRDKSGAIDADKVQRKIDIIVTENVSEAFGEQMKKVKKEMDASRAGMQTEAMAKAKSQLLNGFGNKSATGEDSPNTWLNRRDSHSLLASTSILPTPPPPESLPADSMGKLPPKAPKAMLGIYSSPLPPSLKGKEKAVEPEEDSSATRERRDSYTRHTLRASPMYNFSSTNGPSSARSPPRRLSSSPSRSSFASHRRGFTGDELPRYRSPPRSRINRSPPDRRGSLQSHSRSPVRTNYSHSPTRSGRRPSPRGRSRPPRSRSRPSRADSRTRTRSFNSRRPSGSRSPPPSASYSNGFRTRSSHKSRSRSTARAPSRGRTFSGGNRPPYLSRSRSPLFNSRHAHEKRPFVRSPSPIRGRRDGSLLDRRSRSPLPRKRKLTHQSSPRSRSPWGRRQRSPSYGPPDSDSPARGRLPGDHANGMNVPYSTPSVRSSGRDYEDSPNRLMSPYGPQPPPSSAPARDYSPPPAPPNPCNNVPGLWLVKVGTDSSKIVEGTFVVEPGFAAMWGLPTTPPEKPNLSVVLLCLSTESLRALYDSLAPNNRTAENIAAAVAELETAWPQDGTLLVDININEASGGKTWLPYEIDPASPLDVTNYIQPGPNLIRFIQLAGMVERTFILYASESRCELKPPDVISRMFDTAAMQIDDPLFNFGPATVAASF